METVVELASRSSGGIDISLLWDREHGTVSVLLVDERTDERLTIAADPERALDVFMHPYAYADRD